ncbi:hypothetical protein XMM379_000831 [Aliiroseovarius sp. xm-m-379]|uniref:DUF1636 family protein n=1 Tax=Aliiroseovarius TaxID=1658781 RepID=UPI001569B0A6|nr:MULTISPECIES: DUF1636 domain-containing protein [Aliiroseovarius]NRP13014.1 hypothetical protein [Aliiroseovarius sp. xm-d-517]NRP24151.1 hypothetical protein [Aliiroseovarius sp. xm-m-379]NRP30037.1 hypothetical protein [Aliiroseovarius sp. xm-m-314]NRP32950.1 hypothetical protein [Aliiroseovarius sp. xm-a-104]NRP40047.1 hypothetical protein [Aliiroseovarius sp. xm-m-339-2]
MTSWITVCDTCKREDWDETTSGGKTDGEKLADLVEQAATGSALKVRRVSCLMGCDNSCNVTVQAHGKLAYTMGRFDPTQDAAEGIVAYAQGHAESENGTVPYRQWPQSVKGHFVTRHHPIPEE